ncbi:MAG TPA: TrkA family potassium uptake protein, partial [Vicinamibacteria bacterium]|nr:TrkA family potassium uptake protein [Vicinamibacteria bacterium]
YAATAIIRAVATGELGAHLGRQRMDRALAALSGHTIICGYGRMGRLVCREFAALDFPFVIVDKDPEVLAGFREGKGLPLVGDATEDAVLREAGVDRAKYLVTVASSDAANLYITMSARLLNEKLFIVARAEDEEAERKLVRAGASRVVSPYSIGGHRVAQAVLRPNVVDFIELATRSDFMDLQLEEVEVGPNSGLAGRSLKDNRLRQDLGLIIVAMKKPDGTMIFNPEGELTIQAGDVLITLGHADQLRRLEALAAPH